MVPDKQNLLDNLAGDMVGDGGSPNVYFVTDGGRVTLVTTYKDIARHAWLNLAHRYPLVESALEDRQTGVLASVAPESDKPGAGLRVSP